MPRKPGDIQASLRDRFHAKVSPEPMTGCWLWDGATTELGYGVIGIGTRQQGTEKAHRVAYRLYHGGIPDGASVLHKCDVPSCVNPDHLFAGSLSDNARDCVAKGRNFVPDNRGERAPWAKLTPESVAHIKRREMTGTSYAKLYSVSRSAVYEIWRGRNWRM